jgi:hypothetical protein
MTIGGDVGALYYLAPCYDCVDQGNYIFAHRNRGVFYDADAGYHTCKDNVVEIPDGKEWCSNRGQQNAFINIYTSSSNPPASSVRFDPNGSWHSSIEGLHYVSGAYKPDASPIGSEWTQSGAKTIIANAGLESNYKYLLKRIAPPLPMNTNLVSKGYIPKRAKAAVPFKASYAIVDNNLIVAATGAGTVTAELISLSGRIVRSASSDMREAHRLDLGRLPHSSGLLLLRIKGDNGSAKTFRINFLHR